MDNPVQEISEVVHLLTQGSPSEQSEALETYFTRDAEFIHPFCRVPSFAHSRHLVHGIFRWYKIMSPHIDIKVNSIAYDDSNLILYLGMTQTFRIWFIPFHKSPVSLTTVLQLERPKATDKYYIKSQEDLYQTNQFMKFIPFLQIGDLQWASLLVWTWQVFASVSCFFLALLFWPVTWVEEHYVPDGWLGVAWR